MTCNEAVVSNSSWQAEKQFIVLVTITVVGQGPVVIMTGWEYLWLWLTKGKGSVVKTGRRQWSGIMTGWEVLVLVIVTGWRPGSWHHDKMRSTCDCVRLKARVLTSLSPVHLQLAGLRATTLSSVQGGGLYTGEISIRNGHRRLYMNTRCGV